MEAKVVRRFGPGPIDRFVGVRIRQRREVLGLSFKDIEKKTEIHSEIIERYEAGLEKISSLHLYKMSEALMTRISSFYIDPVHGRQHESEKSWPEGMLGWQETKRLLHIYYGIEDPLIRLNILSMMARISNVLATRQVDGVGSKR